MQGNSTDGKGFPESVDPQVDPQPHLECYALDQNTSGERSTSREPEQHHEDQNSKTVCGQIVHQQQLDSGETKPPMSCGLKMASANLKDQTLHLTVRLQQEEREEEEEQEEEQEGEIISLINSDGEVVDWDARGSIDHGCDSTGAAHTSSKVKVLSESKVQSQNQRESTSPTLMVEVATVEDDEEREGGEKKETVVKKTTVPPSYHGKRRGRKKKVPEVVVSLDCPEGEKDVPANPGNRRGRKKKVPEVVVSLDFPEGENDVPDNPVMRRCRRKISESPLGYSEGEPGSESPPIKRRTRKKSVTVSSEEKSKTLRPTSGKRCYRKRKAALPSAAGEKVKRRPGRKMRLPIEIPPELLKKPREKINYHCSVCGKDFPHAFKLVRHERTHTGEKPYSCSICGRGFNQKGNLKTHYKVHRGHKGIVDWANEVNPVASGLPEYSETVPGESRIGSSLCCLECGKTCESLSALQAHHITTHTQTTADTNAVTHTALQLHLCRRCDVQFSDKEQLEQHMKSHVKEKPYSCPDCGKRFINESYIQVHQRIHTGEKPFLCSQCGKGYRMASSLKLHELQHSGDRPFSCSLCGKRFLINSYLLAHYQTHTKNRPFLCSVCGKGYSRAEELKVHHRIHTGERPYQCDECERSFMYRQGLRQHQRTHAGKSIGPTRQLGRPKQQPRLEN